MSDIISIAEMRIDARPLEKANKELERMQKLGSAAQSAMRIVNDTLSRLSKESDKFAQKANLINNALSKVEKENKRVADAAERDAKKKADAEAREAKRAADAREREAKRAAAAEVRESKRAEQERRRAAQQEETNARKRETLIDGFISNLNKKVQAERSAGQSLMAQREREIAQAERQAKTEERAAQKAAQSRSRADSGYRGVLAGSSPDAAAFVKITNAQRALNIAFEQGVISADTYKTTLDIFANTTTQNVSAGAQTMLAKIGVLDKATLDYTRGIQKLDIAFRANGITRQQYEDGLKSLKVEFDVAAAKAQILGTKMDAAGRELIPFAGHLAKLQAELKELEIRMGAGQLVGEKYQNQMKVLRATIADLAPTVTKAQNHINQYGASMAGFFRTLSRGLRGQGIQNIGFQVQDLAVQLASGQSAALALSQQIPQLLIGFGAAGAVIGALVAVGGALYILFGSLAESQKRLQKATDDATSALDAYTKAVELSRSPIKDLQENFAGTSEEVRRLTTDLRDLARENALGKLKTQFEEAFSVVDFDGLRSRLDAIDKISNAAGEENQVRRLSRAINQRFGSVDNARVIAEAQGNLQSELLKPDAEKNFISIARSARTLLDSLKGLDNEVFSPMRENLLNIEQQARIAANTLQNGLKESSAAAANLGATLDTVFTSAANKASDLSSQVRGIADAMFDLSSATRTAEQTLEIEKIRTQFKDSPVEAARQVAITRERQRLAATLTPSQLQDPLVQQGINRLGDLAAQTEAERQNRRPAKKERGAAQREKKLDTLVAQADSAKFLRRQVVDLGISFEQAERNLLVYNAQVQQGVTANSTLGKEIDRLIRAKAEDERITNELKEEYESMKSSLENIMGPLKAYQEETRNLNRLLQDGKISQQQYNDAIRKTRLAYLENQTTVEAGVERTFLKFTDSAADFAGQTENLLTTAFEGAGDVIANFARTGKLEVADLVREINAQLLKIAFNEIFTQAMGGEAGGGMFSKIFSGLTNVVLGAAGGGVSLSPASTGISGGLLNVPAFASGGSFEVGPQTSLGNISAGADNRLVAFAARDGEVVDVRTPGQAGGRSGGGMTINVNIMTNDAESFRKSQSQVSADIARAVRAGSRNL